MNGVEGSMPLEETPIYAGTQVVTLVEVMGSHGVIVHPRGAVGVVTRTPAGEERLYFVRFPDGFEAGVERVNLEVLKHYKAALTGPVEPFDLNPHIIYECIAGSRAYGLESEGSDTDIRGVFVAPHTMTLSLFGAPEQFEDSARQSCHWEIRKFLLMALKANPNVLECLYSPLVEKVSPAGEKLLACRDAFLSQLVYQTFNGYAMSQFKKIEQDRRNHGDVRWKHAMHLIRLLLTGTRTLRDGAMSVRVEEHRERLLQVKRGELPWDEVDQWRMSLHREFDEALTATKLPPRPDYTRANRLLLEIRESERH